MNSRKKFFLVFIVFILLMGAVALWFGRSPTNPKTSADLSLPSFTKEQLKKYNGTNPKLPIYLALDGDVYDVSKGKMFYQVGGSYHYLAGRDSSFELHIVGADIIKRKYPVVGRLAVNN